jgi:hypothetical protein
LRLHPGECEGKFNAISLVQVVLLACVIWGKVLSNQPTNPSHTQTTIHIDRQTHTHKEGEEGGEERTHDEEGPFQDFTRGK